MINYMQFHQISSILKATNFCVRLMLTNSVSLLIKDVNNHVTYVSELVENYSEKSLSCHINNCKLYFCDISQNIL